MLFRSTAFFAFATLLSGQATLLSAAQDEWVPNHLKPAELNKNLGDLPSLDFNVGGDEHKRVFLIGLDEEADAPRGGYGLIVILAGGTGGPEFSNFAHFIQKLSVPEDFLTLHVIAPEWKQGQFETLVWPTERDRLREAKFTTEEFVTEAIEEVTSRTRINKKKVFSLSWSSGGPPVYSLSLQKKTPLRGSLILMSVFVPSKLPSLSRAKGYRYCLMQSPSDERTKFHHAQAAKEALEKKGATVRLVSYEGGHVFPDPRWSRLKAEFEWLMGD